MKNARSARCDGRRRLQGVYAATRGFTADEAHAAIAYKVIKRPYRVTAAAHAGDDCGGQPVLLFEDLGARLARNYRLEISYYCGKRVGAHNRTEAVVRIRNAVSPLAHALVDGVLQGLSARSYGVNTRAEQLHAVDVERLADGVLLAHVNFALHAQQSRRRGGCHAVLTRARFGYQPLFAHFFGEQRLTERVVYFMRARVV